MKSVHGCTHNNNDDGIVMSRPWQIIFLFFYDIYSIPQFSNLLPYWNVYYFFIYHPLFSCLADEVPFMQIWYKNNSNSLQPQIIDEYNPHDKRWLSCWEFINILNKLFRMLQKRVAQAIPTCIYKRGKVKGQYKQPLPIEIFAYYSSIVPDSFRFSKLCQHNLSRPSDVNGGAGLTNWIWCYCHSSLYPICTNGDLFAY